MLVISGCIGGESTPATATPLATKKTTFSPELLEEQLRLLLMNMAYDEEAARSVAREVVGWKDEQDEPLIGSWEGELIDKKQLYKDGNITIDELTEVEVRIARELSYKIKTEIPEYRVENWHLGEAIESGGANCVGYTQMLYVLGKAVGLSIEPIEVLMSSDIKEGHVTSLIGLSDESKMMVELTSSPVFISQAFTLEDEYRTAGNYLELLKDYSMLPHSRIRIMDQDGLMASLFISRGHIYASSGEYLRVIAEIKVALDLDPEYALAYNNRGVAFHELGYDINALEDLDKAIELNPEFAEAYSNRGVVHVAFENYSVAVSDYNRAMELGSESAVTYYNRGSAYAGLGEYSSAISDYDMAIELDPEYAKAYHGRGDVYNYLEDYDSAMSDYTSAVVLDQEFAEAFSNRGIIYASRKDYSSAVSDYTSAIRLNPNLSVTYYNRGNAHYNLKEYASAVSDYTSAIELNPDFAEAYNSRGNAYRSMGETQKAESDFDTAALLDPRFER